ncbi:DNA-processing protein DprA [Nocardioides daejeonensis]|uniref:DNA-processing protein DprA n=1 Tax=Nocardioides daejeonensis TaxID=1046556 RepID=UPI000D749B4B|nr:DNA-processing protein DprA [Nocardioides daejeonensis]
MSREAERQARLVLSRVTEPGTAKVRGLVDEIGAVALRDHLAADRGRSGPSEVAQRIAALEPERELDRARRTGLRYVIPGDPEWPRGLDDLDVAEMLGDVGGAPLGVWVRGPMRLAALGSAVAIVGSRSATSYGVTAALDLAAALAQQGVTVVSGAAFGIDQAAHRGALGAGGTTVAVLASGADRPYPVAHTELISYIAEHGAVMSEMPPGYAPMRNRFLSRNRIIAALASGTVVVEAAARSGALNTAGWTARLSRPLMAMPGPIGSGASRGTNELIRAGGATLVTSADDVLELLARMGEKEPVVPRGPEIPRDALSRRQSRVLDAVPSRRPVGEEAIARTASLSVAVVSQELAELHDRGFVESVDDGWRITDLARQ